MIYQWRVRMPDGAAYAMASFGGVAATNLMSGIVLARGLSVEDRGFAAVVSVLIALFAVVGSLGAAELVVKNHGQMSVQPATRFLLVVGACIAALATVCVLLAVGHSISLVDAGIVAVSAALSGENMLSTARLFRVRGMNVSSSVRLLFAGSTLLMLTGLIWIGNGRLNLTQVFATWLFAEVLLFIFCGLLLLRSSTFSSWSSGGAYQNGTVSLTARHVLRCGVPHAISQLGTALRDRGLIFVGASGGLEAAALIAVTQGSAAPITMPVGSLTNPILKEAGDPNAVPRHYARMATLLTLVAMLASIPIVPLLVLPFYGPQYSGLIEMSWLIALGGGAQGWWRLMHIQLRGAGKPFLATLSDAVGLGCAFIIVLSGAVEMNAGGVIAVFFSYSMLGALSAAALEKLSTRSERLA